MKIVKLPFKMEIVCDCGCIFEFEYEDICIETFTNQSLDGDKNVFNTLYIDCPLCGRKHILKKSSKL